jgi:REP element-mobilizing transposase RayT
MARKPREEAQDAIHHVTARGVARRALFRDDLDRVRYLRMLGVVVIARGWRCLSYCLMDNHVHLLIETPNPNLAIGMQRVHGNYGRSFNQRHGLTGHVFQARYNPVRVRSDRQLWAVAAYIADNPVEAGLSERPEDWRWSSHAAFLGRPGPHWLDAARLQERLRGFGAGEPQAALEETIAGRRASASR